jgi:4-hydroxyphenylpyruvate dioxygenase
MAHKYGFEGIELFYEDLVDFANVTFGNTSDASQIAAARIVRELCDARNLAIICLQPFMHYEGLLDRQRHSERIEEMHLWMKLMHALGSDLILLPSSNLPAEQMTTDMSLIVDDMAEIADIGAAADPPVRFAFEALCWGTRIDTWEGSWDVVRKVNRKNFGLCLDTFNLTGRIYADPAQSTGRTPNCEETVRESLSLLLASVPVEQIFLLQVADAELLSQPISPKHPFYNPEQPPRMSWSRNARLFYGEPSYGGYLPVYAVLKAVIRDIGFTGWLSFEVFNRRLADKDPQVPEEMASRAAISFDKMTKDLKLNVAAKPLSSMEEPRPML